jgi:hypothetical protein
MTTWTPCEHYRVTMINGQVVCSEDLARANAKEAAQTALYIVPLLIVLGFIIVQLRKRQREQQHERDIAVARYNRLLELLRDVKWGLLNRNTPSEVEQITKRH